MGHIFNKQRNILEFALSSLLRRRRKNLRYQPDLYRKSADNHFRTYAERRLSLSKSKWELPFDKLRVRKSYPF